MLGDELRGGLAQLVVLGAGFDSRSLRFADALRGVRVFEVDFPEVLQIRNERLSLAGAAASAIAVPIDFDANELERRYLGSLPGRPTRAWGCMRIAHAVRSGANTIDVTPGHVRPST